MIGTDTLSALLTLIILQVAFIVMKAFKLNDWSWWVVFSPTWTVIILGLVILIAEKLTD